VFIIVVVYFVIDSVRKLLDTPSYITTDRSFSVSGHFTVNILRKDLILS